MTSHETICLQVVEHEGWHLTERIRLRIDEKLRVQLWLPVTDVFTLWPPRCFRLGSTAAKFGLPWRWLSGDEVVKADRLESFAVRHEFVNVVRCRPSVESFKRFWIR